ncbi:MAG: hypothetical protein N4A38_03055 [Candidatus Gracilibacteria bacterium]|nr:hypothetical protein [Candidatus Gracilibacteria bacterium]
MKKIKKIMLSVSSLAIISAGIYIGIEMTSTDVKANADTACHRTVQVKPCTISSYGPWQAGKRWVTAYADYRYFNYRTNGGCSGGSSGFASSDYATVSCSFWQYDGTSPIPGGG